MPVHQRCQGCLEGSGELGEFVGASGGEGRRSSVVGDIQPHDQVLFLHVAECFGEDFLGHGGADGAVEVGVAERPTCERGDDGDRPFAGEGTYG